jgi:ABC-type transport system involved in Fe-S cluster assembly fused permease/ATPase subunit
MQATPLWAPLAWIFTVINVMRIQRPHKMALRRALCLGQLIEHMPAGMQQSVGNTGWKLSHGEKSRVFSRARSCKTPSASCWTRALQHSIPSCST